MAAPAYIWHLTLDTGHGRRSLRSEISAAALQLARRLLDRALAGLPAEVMPGYALEARTAAGALLATVSGGRGPLVTIAVARTSLQSAALWQLLSQPSPVAVSASGPAPEAPWCAVRLYPALGLDHGATAWLGDLESCLAWAWVAP